MICKRHEIVNVVSLNRNCLQLFIMMPTDNSYGISNRKKCIIFMSFREKQCVNYGVYRILLTATSCIHVTTILKYNWRREVLKLFWSCLNSVNYVVKTISRLATTLPRSVLTRTTDIVHISIPSCHTSGTNHITLFIIP